MTPEEKQKFVRELARELSENLVCPTDVKEHARRFDIQLTAKLAPLFALVEAAEAAVAWEEDYRTLNHLGKKSPYPFEQCKAALAHLQEVLDGHK